MQRPVKNPHSISQYPGVASMATKGDHEKPETVDDEHQPIVKKVRLDVDAKVAEVVKKVKIDENAAPQPEIGGHEKNSTSSPVKEQETGDDTKEKEDEEKVVKPNIAGSAFGGFTAFTAKNSFAAFKAPADSNGFGTKASSSTDTGFGGFASTTSSGVGDSTPSASSDAPSSSGFASFQSTSPVTFASFAAAQPTTDGFGAKASAASAIDFSDEEVAKKVEPVVPALREAELANGEEGERILVEKRAKLFKLVEKDYAEVGIGPLRVLNAKDAKADEDKSTARIVMRRESYPHGPGTKLLMNASLSSCLLCEKKTEKTMLLSVLEANEDPEAEKQFVPATYLMRFGSPEDLDVVMMRIQSHTNSTAVASSS
ncbi:E3 SUMO-protein ligase RanBP2 [Phytophthora citrophthora]|uniref:E3 SUMO-protein ligase RanBP2 n=1 Tax=Phytophthora citrophthora TaxID=4793 RepID=A0AAD9LHJ9_9STRA|nr:E3 SUMO-protein ligase RanBP2 [Phytophthora citrophthora]